MSLTSFVLILAVLLGSLGFLLAKFSRSESSRNIKKLPPGPRGTPIIGHLTKLGKLPHQTLARLTKTYGPIMSIKLGSVRTIVVSSPRAAELFLKTHDSVFASRPKIQAAEIMWYGNKTMGLQQYNPYWRNVRKLCVVNFLSSSKLAQHKPIRAEMIGLMVNHLRDAAKKEEVVNVSELVAKYFENFLYKMFLGGRDHDDDDMTIKEIVAEMLKLVGALNVSDYLPLLAPLDLQGFARRMKQLSKSMDKILEKSIKVHNQEDKDHVLKDNSFVDVLLSMLNQSINPNEENSEIMDKNHIKSIILDMFAGVQDTSAIAIGWIFSEILKNPRIMRKLKEEFENVLGMNRTVQESDLSKLAYLDIVVKEGLRLHPVAPFLIPHESLEDVMVDGYYIPKRSRVLVNTWAIGRDIDVWSDNADEFYPERFESNNVDIHGRDFKLIPFGSGRRMCPGMLMGLLNVKLVLAHLVHCFDWKLPNGMVHEDIDMDEKFGLALGRANDVFARPIYRLIC